MTLQEFSDEFDILYNNVMSNKAPGLNEYEKSFFLTKALNEIIKAYFNTPYTKAQQGFDSNQKRQYDFSTLIRVAKLFNVNTYKERISDIEKLDRRSLVFIFPLDYFLSINEIITDSNNQQYSVTPISYDNYQNLMLKPYPYPTKREAWRIFTDKKNCNYTRQYITVKDIKDTLEDIITTCDYFVLSTWADLKRNISLNIKTQINSDLTSEEIIESHVILFSSKISESPIKLLIDSGWSNNKLTYNISITVESTISLDDESTIKVIKEGFNLLLKIDPATNKQYIENKWDTSKAATHLDCLVLASAPSKFSEFSKDDGKTFTTEWIELPIAEIIGNFHGNINYLIRYIKKPLPIILSNLEGVSIEGLSVESNCQLPSELHHEILQRAVELAKAAYIGDLNSLIMSGQASATEFGIVSQSKL